MTQLLMVHGAPGDARTWTPVIDALGHRDARAITLSFFASAGPVPGGEAFGTDRHANDLVAYIEEAMDAPVDLVAWSYGVHPALLAAKRRPELFRRMFLYEPGLPTYVADEEARLAFDLDAPLAFGPIAMAMQQSGAEAAIEALMDSSGGEGFFASLPVERQRIYRDSAGMMPLLMGGGQPPADITPEDIADIELAITVAVGEQTRPVFAIPSRALADGLPHGILQTVPQAGHMLPEAEPGRFAGLLREWLDRDSE